jgi:flagellar assembly protein FliH
LSRIFKNGAGAEIAPFELAGDAAAPGGAVHAHQFRQVGSPRSALSGGAQAAAAKERPAEPPAPPPPDVEAIKQAAYGQGYAAGEQAGAERAAKQFESVMESFCRTTEELAAYKPALRAEAEQELVKLALIIAQRVIHREVQVDRSSVVGIVRACIGRINEAEIHRLRVNPADAEVVADYFRQTGRTEIEIVPDHSVAPGGAILHTSQGQLDARLESQLREIEYGLADR